MCTKLNTLSFLKVYLQVVYTTSWSIKVSIAAQKFEHGAGLHLEELSLSNTYTEMVHLLARSYLLSVS